MKILLDFKCCKCGSVHEAYVDADTKCVKCSDCGERSYKQMSMPTVKLEGITGAFPGAHEKWAKIREDNARNMARRGLLT